MNITTGYEVRPSPSTPNWKISNTHLRRTGKEPTFSIPETTQRSVNKLTGVSKHWQVSTTLTKCLASSTYSQTYLQMQRFPWQRGYPLFVALQGPANLFACMRIPNADLQSTIIL